MTREINPDEKVIVLHTDLKEAVFGDVLEDDDLDLKGIADIIEQQTESSFLKDTLEISCKQIMGETLDEPLSPNDPDLKKLPKDAEALFQKGLAYSKGNNIRDFSLALFCLEQAGDQGVKARIPLLNLYSKIEISYLYGKNGYPIHHQKALLYRLKSAGLETLAAQKDVINAFLQGKYHRFVMPTHIQLAEQWWLIRIELLKTKHARTVEGMKELAALYAEGINGKQYPQLAFEWRKKERMARIAALEKAASDPTKKKDCYYELWLIYAFDKHVKDIVKAASYLELAHIHQHPLATKEKLSATQTQIGLHYLEGDNIAIPQDLAAAVAWFTKAANANDAKAQYHLGMCFLDGQGVTVNSLTGVNWLEKAAQQKHADANYQLALLHRDGVFGKVDLKQALTFANHAEKLGHPNAKKLVARLKERMAKKDMPKPIQITKDQEERQKAHMERIALAKIRRQTLEEEEKKKQKAVADQQEYEAKLLLDKLRNYKSKPRKKVVTLKTTTVPLAQKSAKECPAAPVDLIATATAASALTSPDPSSLFEASANLSDAKNLQAPFNELAGDTKQSPTPLEESLVVHVDLKYGPLPSFPTTFATPPETLDAFVMRIKSMGQLAFLALCQAAEQENNDFAQEILADLYAGFNPHFPSLQIQVDTTKAIYWYQKLAAKGEATYQYNLGVAYANGYGGLKEDVTEGLRWFLKSADRGYALALYECGHVYMQMESPNEVREIEESIQHVTGYTDPQTAAIAFFKRAIQADQPPTQITVQATEKIKELQKQGHADDNRSLVTAMSAQITLLSTPNTATNSDAPAILLQPNKLC